MSFEVKLISLIKPFLQQDLKSHGKNLHNKQHFFEIEITFFIIFKRLSMEQIAQFVSAR